MNSFITNKKELPEHVWAYIMVMLFIGILFIVASTDPLWIRALINFVFLFASIEACANTYTTFTFESGKFIVGLPYRKYSLLWIKANRILAVEDELWDEVQIIRLKNRRGSGIFRRTFFFMKNGELAYYFSAIGCEDFENELGQRYSEKHIHVIENEMKYKELRPFLENRKERVI